MAKTRFNAGRLLLVVAVLIALALIAGFVLTQLQERGLI
jgi:hypothetical protein